MTKMNRRDFLKSSGVAAAIPALGVAGYAQAAETRQEKNGANPDYPDMTVSNISRLAINKPVSFTYPDADSPCVLIRMGRETPGGVGPDRDIVAYSILCKHMGCSLMYVPESRTFRCPCHFSIFDSEKGGQMVSGQATEDMPQIRLTWDESSGTIKATGVDGLIFGRQANVL